MPDVQIGPFTLQGQIIRLFLVSVFGYGVMYLRLKKSGAVKEREALLSMCLNALLVFVMIWKFGSVFSLPSLLWKRPLAILFYTGGLLEIWLGIAAAVIVLIYSLRKARISVKWAADVLSFGIIAGLIMYELLAWRYGKPTDLLWGIQIGTAGPRYHPLNIYAGLVNLAIFIRLLWKKETLGSGNFFRDFAIGWGMGLLLVSLFEIPSVGSHFTLLTWGQLGAILWIVFGLYSSQLLSFIDLHLKTHNNRNAEGAD